METETTIPTTPPPAIPPEIEAAIPKSHIPFVPIIIVLLLLMVSVGVYFYFQSSTALTKSPSITTSPVPEISVDQELDQINLDSMDSDFQELDSSATGL